MEEIEIPNVAVMVSRELVTQLLDDWSEPVQVRISRASWSPTGWEMETRNPFPNTAKGAEITEETSDGYHTFRELYDHRRALTAALVKTGRFPAWRSKRHHPDDSPIFDGYFIIGIELPDGPITYHYELKYWDDFRGGADDLDHAPKWDGADANASVTRLIAYARG